MPEPRLVAGLLCTDVLARLSDFVDGELSAEEVEQVLAHLRGCDWCERFGGQFVEVLAGLRETLGPPDELDPEVEARLDARLDALFSN